MLILLCVFFYAFFLCLLLVSSLSISLSLSCHYLLVSVRLVEIRQFTTPHAFARQLATRAFAHDAFLGKNACHSSNAYACGAVAQHMPPYCKKHAQRYSKISSLLHNNIACYWRSAPRFAARIYSAHACSACFFNHHVHISYAATRPSCHHSFLSSKTFRYNFIGLSL